MSTPKKSAKSTKPAKSKSTKTSKTKKETAASAEKRDRGGNAAGARKTVPRVIRIAGLIYQGICPPKTRLSEIFEVDVRTIERDFDYLRGYCHMKFEFDYNRNVHHSTTPTIPLPGMQLTAPEIMALLVAGRAVQYQQGAGLSELTSSAIEKITTFMTVAQAGEWTRVASLFSYCGVPSVEQLNSAIFPTLSQALLDSEELEIFYLKRDADAPEWRRVRPLHLFFRSNRWYLWALDHARELTGRRFVLSEIHELRRTGVTFERPADFNPEEVLANTMGLYGGGEPELVRLRLDRRAARWFERERIHPSQQITPQPDGTFELTMKLAITPDLEGNLLLWATQIDILEPLKLHEAVQDKAKAILERGRMRSNYQPKTDACEKPM